MTLLIININSFISSLKICLITNNALEYIIDSFILVQILKTESQNFVDPRFSRTLVLVKYKPKVIYLVQT